MEVYTFQGHNGEEVPLSVEKLIVKEGVLLLPEKVCYAFPRLQEVILPHGLNRIELRAFAWCQDLLEVKIGSNMKYIGKNAFFECVHLAKVEFEFSTPSPNQLQTIEQGAFCHCKSLSRIKLPASVTAIGINVFNNCSVLIEANLSTTCVTEIQDLAFSSCRSLQTASLPNTLERIGDNAFYECFKLVTVVVPLDTQAIQIGFHSFYCSRLANLVLPKDSTAQSASFSGCELLQERYGEDSPRILAGLIRRYDHFAIHRMCYDHSVITVQKLLQCIADQYEEGGSLVDEFGMNPFHVFFLTPEPSAELLEVLLDHFPSQILTWKDANGKRPLEYLLNNWTDGTLSLLRRTLQKCILDPLVNWGAMMWVEETETKVRALLSNHDKEQRLTLINELYSAFGRYEKVETTSILELALWKGKLKSGWNNDGSKRQTLDRVECQCVCGSDVVISNVTRFLLG